MPPDETNGRATVAQVYEIVNELRKEFREDIRCLSDEQSKRFDELVLLVAGLRDDFVSKEVFDIVAGEVKDLRAQTDQLKRRVWTALGGVAVLVFIAPYVIDRIFG